MPTAVHVFEVASHLFGRLDFGSARKEHQAVLLCQHTAVGWTQMCLACANIHDSTQHGLVEASACFAKGLTHQGGKYVLQSNISALQISKKGGKWYTSRDRHTTNYAVCCDPRAVPCKCPWDLPSCLDIELFLDKRGFLYYMPQGASRTFLGSNTSGVYRP